MKEVATPSRMLSLAVKWAVFILLIIGVVLFGFRKHLFGTKKLDENLEKFFWKHSMFTNLPSLPSLIHCNKISYFRYPFFIFRICFSQKMTQNGPLSNKSESESESEDEYKVEEESPCGRWHKRKEQVSHRYSLNFKNGKFLSWDGFLPSGRRNLRLVFSLYSSQF